MRKLLSSLLALSMLTTFSGCSTSTSSNNKTSENATTNDPDEKAAKETIDNYFKAVSTGDFDSLTDYCTDDYAEDSELEELMDSMEALREEMTSLGLDEQVEKEFETFVQKVFGNIFRDYKVTKITKKDNKITAVVRVTGIDVSALEDSDALEDTLTENALSDEMMAKYEEKVTNATTEEEQMAILQEMISEIFQNMGNVFDEMDETTTKMKFTLVKEDGEWLIDRTREYSSSSNDTKEAKKTTSKTTTKEDTSTTDSSGSIKIIDSGYSVDDTGYMHGVAIIENTNSNKAYSYPSVVITAYDESGDVLSTTEDYASNTIQPGDKQFVYFIMDCNDETPSKVDFKIKEGTQTDPDSTVVQSKDLELVGVKERVGKYENVSYTGSIKNNSKTDCDFVYVTVVFRKDGKIVGGDSSYLSSIEAGAQEAFEIDSYSVPDHDAFEISASCAS